MSGDDVFYWALFKQNISTGPSVELNGNLICIPHMNPKYKCVWQKSSTLIIAIKQTELSHLWKKLGTKDDVCNFFM